MPGSQVPIVIGGTVRKAAAGKARPAVALERLTAQVDALRTRPVAGEASSAWNASFMSVSSPPRARCWANRSSASTWTYHRSSSEVVGTVEYFVAPRPIQRR